MRIQNSRFAPVATLLVAGLLAFGVAASASDDTNSALLGLKVKTALLEKLGVDALHVTVDSMGSAKVKLAGTVNKRATSELASTVAKSVVGVTFVDNDIKLAEYKDSKEKVGNAVTETEREVKDGLLEVKVREALISSLGGDGMKVGTEAASGTLTLAFPADFSAALRTQAETAAKGVSGVTKVVTLDKKS
ncbi:MAG: BON domain-containing protein [Acidobacteriota bacterium]